MSLFPTPFSHSLRSPTIFQLKRSFLNQSRLSVEGGFQAWWVPSLLSFQSLVMFTAYVLNSSTLLQIIVFHKIYQITHYNKRFCTSPYYYNTPSPLCFPKLHPVKDSRPCPDLNSSGCHKPAPMAAHGFASIPSTSIICSPLLEYIIQLCTEAT